MKTTLITWHEGHSTIVRVDTHGRRSRWTRRLVRAARRGDLELAWKILIRSVR